MALRILFVDDNPLAAEATVAALNTDGHRVEWLASAELALARHAPGRWDLILTDLRLPRMSGWELIARLHEREPALAAGVLTGWSPAPGDPPASARGARFLLVKPVDPQDLLAELAAVETSLAAARLQDAGAAADAGGRGDTR